jgi:4'-phosphopantetheinyl transferase
MIAPRVIWHSRLAAARPGPGEVRVWLLDLESDEVRDLRQRLGACLDSTTLMRAARLHLSVHREWLLRSHSTARWLLAQALGMAPAQVLLSSGRDGKPRLGLQAGTLAFNWSRSGQWFFFGLASCARLGVDVEREMPNLDFLSLARAHWPARVADGLQRQPASARGPEFYRLWTRFEAYAKALGCGVATPAAAAGWHTAGPPWHIFSRAFELPQERLTATLALYDVF